MKTKSLWLTWLYLFALCAVLGFVPQPTGLVKAILVLLSVGFFVPGFLLLFRAGKEQDKKTLRLIRSIAIVSLVVTMGAIMLNFASALLEKVWGTVFYIILVIVSSPMVCGQYWVIGLFGWACLMVTAITMLQKKI